MIRIIQDKLWTSNEVFPFLWMNEIYLCRQISIL